MTKFDFAVITPLPEEWYAVRAILQAAQDLPFVYPTTAGSIGQFRVAVTMPAVTGGYAASDLTRLVVERFRPRWVALVGVAGGFVAEGVQLGDVVFASYVYAYEYGKISGGNFQRRETFDFSPDLRWLARARILEHAPKSEQRGWKKRIFSKRPDKKQRMQTKLSVGNFGSGEKVVDDLEYPFFVEALFNHEVPSKYKLKAIEMEGAGSGATISSLQTELHVGFIMIRGISDLPPQGTMERDNWKPYAAAAAAAFLEHLLSQPISAAEPVVGSDLPNFPSPRSLSHPPTNLTALPTPLIGRDEELAAAVRMMSEKETSLVTLTGTGGVGKTRLALEVAVKLRDAFPDGVFFVDLSALRDPELVMSTIVATLRVREVLGQNHILSLTKYLAEKSMLLVLDNFEQVVDAAPNIATLLAASPMLRLLVTSRKRLNIRAEREISVVPFLLPEATESNSLDALAQSPAIKMFVARVAASKSGFALTDENVATVADICRRLDGLPLSIELAAARVKGIPLVTLLSRLDQPLKMLIDGPRDLPPRQRTLRDMIAWSYDLLDPAEQALFRALSVFRGGWTLEAAERVARPLSDHTLDIAVVLSLLVDQGLVFLDEGGITPRYRMLPTIMDFGIECLNSNEQESEVQNLHAQFFVRFARESSASNETDNEAFVLDRLEDDYDNFRGALEWLFRFNSKLGLELASELWWFWWVRGHLTEGRDWLVQALSYHVEGASRAQVKALIGLGTIADTQGEQEIAVANYEEALAISETIGDASLKANSLVNLGDIATFREDFPKARSLFRDALELSRSSADLLGTAKATRHLGLLAFFEGDEDGASVLFTESLAQMRRIKNIRGIATALTDLSIISLNLGEFEAAFRQLEEAEKNWRKLNDKQGLAPLLATQGRAYEQLGKLDRAESFLEAALDAYSEIGDQQGIGITLTNLGLVAIQRENPDQAKAHLIDGLSRLWAIDDKSGVSRALLAVAELEIRRKQVSRAARLLGAVEVIFWEMSTGAVDSEQELFDRIEGEARAALGEAEFSVSRKSGQLLRKEQMLEFALVSLEEPGFV